MPFNLPRNGPGGEKRLSLGIGKLYIGAAGTTPTQEVGYCRSAQFSFTRTRLELEQGVPATVVFQFIRREEAILNFVGLEWSINRLKDVFGVTNAIEGADGQGAGGLGVGGDPNIDVVALMLVHQMPSGGTITLSLYRAQAQGESSFSFGDEFNELPYAFKAIVASTDWGGTSLASTKQLFRVVQVAPPGGGFGAL